MSAVYLETEGVIVPATALEIPRAKALAEALGGGRLPYVELVECRRRSSEDIVAETVVFDVEPERPQRCVHPIQRRERIAAVFQKTDAWYPEVVALRGDFPSVPHTNLRPTEFPRSLCLYDQPWPQIALRWTPTGFIERIRFWLAETAKGTLHQADQPLEPLLFGGGYKIILPADFYVGEPSSADSELKVTFATKSNDCRVLWAERGRGVAGLPFMALSFVAAPQMHGSIRHAPQNLYELAEFVRPAGIYLIDRLHERIADWNTGEFREKKLMIVIAFPLTRDQRLTVETSHVWAFLTASSIAEVGIAIGRWEKGGGHGLGVPLVRNPEADGRDVKLEVMSPLFDLSRETAAVASGVEADRRKVVSIGQGALGSQLVRLLAQSGFGTWTCIDEDVLLPHNTARHAQNRRGVGMPKALTTAFEAREFYVEDEKPQWICADVLRPEDEQSNVEAALSAAELVLDTAAAIPVSRFLTHEAKCPGRRISLFLNPSGTDLVMLAEDAERVALLDSLEMQYYRAVVEDEQLRDHLSPPPGRVRYARSCRDVTSTIPNYLVALHAAIGANAVRQALKSPHAGITVWRSDPTTTEVRQIEVPVGATHRSTIDGWTLIIDERLRTRLMDLRAARLPVETGGVLIGAYDLQRKIVYAVDTIPSPPDSQEWPTLYIRGSQGLSKRVQDIQTATDGQLEYIGEWHSHPDGCDCGPSEDDLKVFSWLTQIMDDAGLPALMTIVGESNVSAWFLGKMLKAGGWEVSA